MTDEERAKIEAISDAATELAIVAAECVMGLATPDALEAAWQRLLALRWQGMDSAPRDRSILVRWEIASGGQAVGRWIASNIDDGEWSNWVTSYEAEELPVPTAWMPLPPAHEE